MKFPYPRVMLLAGFILAFLALHAIATAAAGA
jgi:hypothetical protein